MKLLVAEAVAQAVAQVMAQTMTQKVPGEQSAYDMRKTFERVEKFDGKAEGWKEWHYQFSVTMHEHSQKNGHVMDLVEKIDEEVSTEDLGIELSEEEAEWMHKTKDQVFSRLIQLTFGEPHGIVRSVEDRNGYVAWKKLYEWYNPRTPASLTAAWRDVIRTKKIKDMREAAKAIGSWEAKVALLRKEHDEEPAVGLKAALLLEMLPDQAQMTVV